MSPRRDPVVGQSVKTDKQAFPRKPDYILRALDRETEQSHRVGCAWMNSASGSVSIKLDRFVALNGKDNPVLTLFRNEEKE